MNQELSYWFSVLHHPNVFRDWWGHGPLVGLPLALATPLPPSVRMYMSFTPSNFSCYFMSANTSVVNAICFVNSFVTVVVGQGAEWPQHESRHVQGQRGVSETHPRTLSTSSSVSLRRPTDRPTSCHGQSRSLIRHGTARSTAWSDPLGACVNWRGDVSHSTVPDIRYLKTSKVGRHH